VTIYSVLSLLYRLVGFAQLADSFWHRHEERVKAQKVANAPTTRAELEKTLKDGEL
jgi:hypothetical protein